MNKWLALFALVFVPVGTLNAQIIGGGSAELVMSGLQGPLGLELDKRARVWLSEMGPVVLPGDGRVSWFYVGQDTLNPFVTGFPIAIAGTEGAGVAHVALDSQDNLLLCTGGPPAPPAFGSVTRFDSTPCVAEAGPYTVCLGTPCPSPVTQELPIAPFVLSNGGLNTNVYSVAEDTNGDLYIADAGGNMIVKHEKATNTLSVFSNLPFTAGSPSVESVPTRIISVPNDGAPTSLALILVELTGGPFVPGTSRVWGFTNAGTRSVLATGLTTVVDCELDPTGNALFVCSAGSFDSVGGIFAPGTGSIERVDLATGTISLVLGGLWLPTGIEFIGKDIYFCAFYEGTMFRFNPCPADLTGDGAVDGADLTLLLGSWGVCP